MYTLSVFNCHIVAGYCAPRKSYLSQYWQHRQSVVCWAAKEGKHTGIDTEKQQHTHIHSQHKKHAYKSHWYSIYIVQNHSDMLFISPDIRLCFCLISYFTLNFFCWEKIQFFWLCNAPQCWGMKQLIWYATVASTGPR